MEESGFEFKNVAHQYFATIAANSIMLGHGCMIGWFTPALPILISDYSPLESGPLTTEELSWLGSINNLGALVGILFFGFITTFLGCKRAMIFLAFPSAAFWIVIYFGTTYHHILFARLIGGITGGGVQTVMVLFISEIANDNIRGRLCSLSPLVRNTGILLVQIVGFNADYFLVPCIFVFCPIVFLFCFAPLPNTAQFHAHRGKTEKAEASLKFYKGYREESQLETNAFNKELNRLKALAKERKQDSNLHLKDFLDPKALRGLLFGITLAFLAQFSAGFTFLNYAVLIFQKSSASSIDPSICVIMMALARLVGCLLSAKLVDSLGRRALMIMSFLGPAIALFVFLIYLYFIQNGYDLSKFDWLPFATMTFIQFIASAGVSTLHSVCFVENLPTKIRTIGLTICTLSLYVSAFIFIKLFPILLDLIDLIGCMMIFAIGSLIGTLFVIYFMHETKGKSLDVLRSRPDPLISGKINSEED